MMKKGKERIYLSSRPRRGRYKLYFPLPWEKEGSGPVTLVSCPRVAPLQRLPDHMYDRLKELARRGGVVIRFKIEPARSGEICLADNQYLNWTRVGRRWVAFVDKGHGAAWSHEAYLYVFSEDDRRGREIRCDVPPEGLYNEKKWQVFPQA